MCVRVFENIHLEDGSEQWCTRAPNETLKHRAYVAARCSFASMHVCQNPSPDPNVHTLALPNVALNVLRWKGTAWQLVVW